MVLVSQNLKVHSINLGLTMKWKKMGKIFDPREHQLPNNCKEFAQSPQALICDDHIRIYFSTRSVDKSNGKFFSYIAFVDFDHDLKTILQVSNKPVIPLGKLGCFDEHGIFPMNVCHYKSKIYAYTCGWSRRVSVSVDTAIGLAISEDNGLTFQKIGDGPVLSASVHEPFLVGDGFVKVINDVFHMWYIFGIGWKHYNGNSEPDRTYKIGHATSNDGIYWNKEEAIQIIDDKLGESESQALPTVVKIDDQYHMFFCYRYSSDFRKNIHRGYRIGHAYSDNLEQWTRDDKSLTLDQSPNEWDSEMQCYPNVFTHNDNVYLLYNGNEFGRDGFGLAILEK